MNIFCFHNWIYDKIKNKYLNLTLCNPPVFEKFAVYLVFQPDGIPGSVISTCRSLSSAGYNVVLVSNSKISLGDRESVSEVVNLIIERHNFGYDFGGYREGILNVLERFNNIKKLIIINDSVWFPLKRGHEIWPQMEALDFDFSGIHSIRKRQGRRFWLNDYNFLPSYALLFNEKLVNSKEFLKFWKCYPLMSSKKFVMQFGERGLSRYFSSAGFSMGCILSDRDIIGSLSGQDPDVAARLIKYIDSRLGAKYKKIRVALLSKSDIFESLLRAHQFLALLPVYSIKVLNVGVIKKNRQFAFIEARRAIVESLDAGDVQSLDIDTEKELRLQVAAEQTQSPTVPK